jgi:hypothetical protein
METIIAKTPTVEIDGTKYEMNRLTTVDAFTFLGVIKKVGLAKTIAAVTSFNENKGNNEAILGAALSLFLNLQEAQDELFTFFAKLLKTEKSEVEALPIDALVTIIQAVLDHPDLKAFTKAVGGLIKVMPQAAGVKPGMSAATPITNN